MSARLAVRPAAADRPVPPAIRLVAAPRSEPPTDEQLTAAGVDAPAMTAPLLPLDLPGSHVRRDRSRSAPTEPSAGPAATGAESPAGVAAEPSPARLATRRFLATCVEVIGGFRPVAHLRPFCFPDRFAAIAERLAEHPAATSVGRYRGLAHLAASARTPLVRRTTGAPPRVGRTHQTSPGDRVSVRRVQMCEVLNGVVEVAVVLVRREHVWAMALRLERRHGRWLCTDLQVV